MAERLQQALRAWAWLACLITSAKLASYEKLMAFMCQPYFKNMVQLSGLIFDIQAAGDKDMNADIFEGKWKQLKGRVQGEWSRLTDDEINQVDGDMTRLAGLIQEKYGKSREDAEEAIEKLMKH